MGRGGASPMSVRLPGPGWRDHLPTAELLLALAAAALWYATGGAVWYRDTGVALWPALLLLPLLPLHWLARRGAARLTAMDLWLFLFVLSACVSVWVAYDREIATAKLGLLLGAAGLGMALAHQLTRRQLFTALAVFALAGAGLALYSIGSADWSIQEAKYPPLARFGRSIGSWLPTIGAHRITPNVAGGMLAVMLPLVLPLSAVRSAQWTGWRLPWKGRAINIVGAVAAAAMLLALVLTASRGAWLGTCGSLALWGLWRWLGRLAGSGPTAWRRHVVGFVLLVLAGILAASIAGYIILVLELAGSESLANRLQLMQQGLWFAQDYPYTGVGLGLFAIPFSVYTLWIHVGYIVYSHNTFVDLLAEQGFMGLVAVLMLWGHVLARFLRWRPQASPGLGLVMEASMASLVAMAIHGLVDNVLYGSRGALLFFVPVGILLSASARVRHEVRRADREVAADLAPTPAASSLPLQGLAGLSVAISLLLLLTDAHPVTAWYANRGALAQTQVELQLYDPEHFSDLELDEVRQRADLSRAESLLLKAAQAPAHPTAPRRLAAVYLARGKYAAALDVMQASWDQGNRDDGTRLVYGDALVANGEPLRAAMVVDGVPFAIARLEGQAWSRYLARQEWEQLSNTYWALGQLMGETDAALERTNDAREKAGLAPLDTLQ
jgi:O-antigen ligase